MDKLPIRTKYRDDQSGWPFFVPLWLCARYIGAASGFGGAARLRAMGEGPPLTQWSLSDQSGGLIPPLACGRGILGRLRLYQYLPRAQSDLTPPVSAHDVQWLGGASYEWV